MSDRRKSVDSFDEFFSETKNPASTVIRSQPVIHHRQKPDSTISNDRSTRSIKQKISPQRYLPYIRPVQRSKPKKKILNPIGERVVSAQRSKYNELKSRLDELKRQLEEEEEENRTLKIIQKREEKALKRFEDKEFDAHRLARDLNREIDQFKEEINEERTNKFQLVKELRSKDDELKDQTTQIRHYEKLIHEKNLDESEELKEKVKESKKKLKQIEEKINRKEKQIENLEKDFRDEIQDELIKQRNLRRELNEKSKEYKDLLMKFDEKNRQVGTMHIYIQRGGRRPSDSSFYRSKSRSVQSLPDASPRYREKILEYDRKRREQEKLQLQLQPKPKPKPIKLPTIERKSSPPIKVQRKIEEIPKKFSKLEDDFFLKEKTILTRRSEEEKSNVDDETIYQSTIAKSPSPLPILQRNENHFNQIRMEKRLSSPLLSPIGSRLNGPGPTLPRSSTLHLTKQTLEPIPTTTTTTTMKKRENSQEKEKWMDFFDTDESSKDDLVSKLISHKPTEKEIRSETPPESPRMTTTTTSSNMKMFEAPSISKKPITTRITTNNNYDFDQAVINLHEGKPVTAQPTSKTSIDPFESLFTKKTSGDRTDRDDTFTLNETKIEPFQSLLPSTTAKTTTVRTISRPKVITNTNRNTPSRTFPDELEEFVL